MYQYSELEYSDNANPWWRDLLAALLEQAIEDYHGVGSRPSDYYWRDELRQEADAWLHSKLKERPDLCGWITYRWLCESLDINPDIALVAIKEKPEQVLKGLRRKIRG